MDQIGPGISWNIFLDWWGAQSHFDNSVAHFFNLVVVCKYLTYVHRTPFPPKLYAISTRIGTMDAWV